MSDRFRDYNETLTGPASFHFLITPDNSADLPNVCRAIRADGAGTITCRFVGSNTEVLYTVSAGEVIPGRVSRVLATGTTVTRIQGWY